MSSLRKLIQLLAPLSENISRVYFLAILQGAFYLAVPLGIQSVVTYTMVGRPSASLFLLSILTILALSLHGPISALEDARQ
jgi:ABC-type bacteriocin/lantibiotic exporter with double-glycine peptidase domain